MHTPQGQRLKKLQARELREEKEEQERIKVDNEERDFQAQCRKDAIERAKTLLYHQTDHVKTFHVSLTCLCVYSVGMLLCAECSATE